MGNSSISIVICTLDRSDFLSKVMFTISSWGDCFQELIVVSGSSQDETELVLGQYKYIINKVIYTDQRNVSVARNLGLYAASQEIIIYLDDDVIPPQDWVKLHLIAYSEQRFNCACVAGKVIDKTNPNFSLQFAHGVSSKLSESRPVLSEAVASLYLSNPDWFPAIMGANASYKREALIRIGGFDEFFEYFLEETDVCLRLQLAGYTVDYIDVSVDHYVQPSHNRRDRRHLTCWYSLAKNTTYFALKHSLKTMPLPIFLVRLTLLLTHRCILRILRLKFTHNLPVSLLGKYIQDVIAGIRYGWDAGIKLNQIDDFMGESKK